MAMIGWIFALLVVAIGIVLFLALQKPDVFGVERRIVINAAPDRIHALINDFRNWRGWSPWENKDPGMTRTLSGPESGPGAGYAWSGNKNVGSGSMTLREETRQRIVIDLHFLKPFEARNVTTFSLNPVSTGTEVVWAMTGPAPLMSKVMQVFMNMDTMIGKDFEAGLHSLKQAAEA